MLFMLACLSLTDIRNAECNIACLNWGFQLGRYEDGYCLCIEKREWHDTQEQRIILPHKLRTAHPRGDE